MDEHEKECGGGVWGGGRVEGGGGGGGRRIRNLEVGVVAAAPFDGHRQRVGDGARRWTLFVWRGARREHL